MKTILTEEEQGQLAKILRAYHAHEYSGRQLDPTRSISDVVRGKVNPTKNFIKKNYSRLLDLRKNSNNSIPERHENSIKTINLKLASTNEKYELLNKRVRTLNKQVQDLSAEKETLVEENNILKKEVEKLDSIIKKLDIDTIKDIRSNRLENDDKCVKCLPTQVYDTQEVVQPTQVYDTQEVVQPTQVYDTQEVVQPTQDICVITDKKGIKNHVIVNHVSFQIVKEKRGNKLESDYFYAVKKNKGKTHRIYLSTTFTDSNVVSYLTGKNFLKNLSIIKEKLKKFLKAVL
jgi:hypothetical protein